MLILVLMLFLSQNQFMLQGVSGRGEAVYEIKDIDSTMYTYPI